MLKDHRCTHDKRSDIDGVFCGKVLDPEKEGGMPHLNGILKSIVKSNKHRDLNQHGEAPAHGVDLSPFVEEHDLLLKLCLIILVLLLEPIHLRLYLLHLLHRFHTDLG